jgi:predicted MFS family arabinose efflux permease
VALEPLRKTVDHRISVSPSRNSSSLSAPAFAHTARIPGSRRAEALLIAALCLIVTVAYGALFYGFAVLITEPAAGGEFSRALLSSAYGGAVLTGGIAAIPVGRLADAHGARWLMAGGAALAAIGLLLFAAAREGWQVLAVWWVLIGPATAMCFYEPAYVAIQQAFAPERRPQAIAALTLSAGLSGPIFTPSTGALVDALGWRDATRVLAAVVAVAVPIALLVRTRPQPSDGARRAWRPDLSPFRSPRLLVFTVGAILAYGSVESVVVHRVARFQELGFGLGTVAVWVGISGLATLPGRLVLPLLAKRWPAASLLAGVTAVLALATALMIGGDSYAQMVLSFLLFGLVFGAALPLRAIVMGGWIATAGFGAAMGVQAAAMSVGRAGLPALTGGLHDALDGYAVAMALLAALLVVAAVLFAWCAEARE